MDFYNLQEKDHRLLEQTLSHLPGTPAYKEYPQRHFFNFDRIIGKKNILLAEEDPRVQRAMQKMIQEANSEAQCWFADSIDEISEVLSEKSCDLLIANYYLSDDEIDYEFWDKLRDHYPQLEVIILSHINDREYYEELMKLSKAEEHGLNQPFSAKIKHFLEQVFGG